MKFQKLQVFCVTCSISLIISVLTACGGETKKNAGLAQEELPAGSSVKVQPKSPEKIIGVVSGNGYKNVHFGMTAKQAKDAFDEGLAEPGFFDNPEIYSAEDKTCYYLNPIDESIEMAFMVVSGIIQRIDIDSPGIVTESGAGIGMRFEDVEALYPGSNRKPNFYTYPVSDLIVDIGDNVQITFEQNNGIIYRYRIGVSPAIGFVEGCQ